jgi:hypothetical protein
VAAGRRGDPEGCGGAEKRSEGWSTTATAATYHLLEENI